ncbi:MAG TPA: lytic transglycosylase domain-containing protein [Actinoplanes sp.]|nr:lytic transglycosylase domain-containing protein [Actinoplanes sp.]
MIGRARGWQLAAAAAVVLAVGAGCGLLGNRTGNTADAAPAAAGASATPSEDPAMYEEATPAPAGPTAEPTPPTIRATTKPKPTPTEDPNNFTEPECATHEGKKISRKAAKSALVAAAAKTYWPTSAPQLKVPADLVKAVAWHESGWQSSIVNCDGGRGLMQVMPDTEEFINTRFEKSYDSHAHRENAVLGANYLAWLTRYFGDNYFTGNYSLGTGKCRSHESRCLLNMVIAGYNAGAGAVDEAYADKRLPNPEYVNSVRHLMKSCYCDRY